MNEHPNDKATYTSVPVDVMKHKKSQTCGKVLRAGVRNPKWPNDPLVELKLADGNTVLHPRSELRHVTDEEFFAFKAWKL